MHATWACCQHAIASMSAITPMQAHLLNALQQLVALIELIQQLLAGTGLQDPRACFGSLHGLQHHT